jgi:hypothetical protein
MTNRDAIAQRRRMGGVDVDYGVVLDVGKPANANGRLVAAHHGVVPHRTALPKGYVSDHVRAWCYKSHASLLSFRTGISLMRNQ